jgi:hypothetical protein
MTEPTPYQITPVELDEAGALRAKVNQLVAVVNELIIAQGATHAYVTNLVGTEVIVGDRHYVTRPATPEPPAEGDWDLTVEENVGAEID